MAVHARQRVAGQHALRSSALAAELVRAAGVRPHELVLDLGAGSGVLTAALVRARARVVAIELDPVLVRRLQTRFDHVVEDDITRVPLPREPFRVVANLPFSSTTAALKRLLDPAVPLIQADVIVEWHLAVKRAAVWPSTRLGVEWSAWHELSVSCRLPRCCFAPQPQVDAAVLRAVRRREPLVPVEHARAYRGFLQRGFRNGPRAVVPGRQLTRLAGELGFDRAARPRDLDAAQWATLFRRGIRSGR